MGLLLIAPGGGSGTLTLAGMKGTTMSTLSGISSNSSSAWTALRNQMQAKMFAKADADSSGGVSKAELQGLFTEAAKASGSTVSSTESDALFSRMDSDGDGSLTSAELGKGMDSLMAPPPPPSTMDFAQSRSGTAGNVGSAGDDLFSKVDTDGNGSVSQDELQSLMDKMAADVGTSSTESSSSASDRFASLDTDGNGSLTQSEFDAGRPSGPPPGGGTPPVAGAGGGGGGGTSATSSTDSTTYDPLDTNKDGVVSLVERLAASSTESTDPVQALLAAIDTDNDGKVSSSESDAFVQQLTALASKNDGTTSTTSDTSTQADTDLARLAHQLYDQVASGLSKTTQASSVSALA